MMDKFTPFPVIYVGGESKYSGYSTMTIGKEYIVGSIRTIINGLPGLRYRIKDDSNNYFLFSSEFFKTRKELRENKLNFILNEK
jgi:hypothetical protein